MVSLEKKKKGKKLVTGVKMKNKNRVRRQLKVEGSFDFFCS